MIPEAFPAKCRCHVSYSRLIELGMFGWLDQVLLLWGVWFVCRRQILGGNGHHGQAKPPLERNEFPDVVPLDPMADPLQEVATAESRQGVSPREECQQRQSRQCQGDAGQVQGEVNRMLMPQAPLVCRRTAPADQAPRNREVVSHRDFPTGQQVHRRKSEFVVIGIKTLRQVSAEPLAFRADDVLLPAGCHNGLVEKQEGA